MSVVIDASLIIALVVADDRQDASRAHIEGWLQAGESLHAPAVLPYEVADVLARLVFDGALGIGEVHDIWDDLAAPGSSAAPLRTCSGWSRRGCDHGAATPSARHRLDVRLACPPARNGRVDSGRGIGSRRR